MHILKRFFAAILLLPFVVAAQQRPADIDSIVKSIINVKLADAKEAIILETDKRMYAAGEALWFKAYTVNTVNNKISFKEDLLFADLVNMNDSVISELVLQPSTLQTNGFIVLPDSLIQGYYFLRAFLPAKSENKTECATILPIFILNNKSGNKTNYDNGIITETSVPKGGKMQAQLFPEGGALISGTVSMVAIKVTDAYGNPLSVSGAIKDKAKKDMARFTTDNKGLGRFLFSPTFYGNYSVYIQNDNNYDSIIALPRVSAYAAQLSAVQQNADGIKIRVMLEDSVFTPAYSTYIIGMYRDSVCFAATGRGMYELDVPAYSLPGGIVNFYLYSSKKELLSRRDIHVPKKNVVVNISTDKPNYSPRNNVKLNIGINDAGGKPLLAALSVSVTDTRVTSFENDFYTDTLAAYTPEEADLILLTKSGGPDVRSVKSTEGISLGNYELFTIKGTLLNRKKEPLPDHQVLLMSTEGTAFVLQDTTDEHGKFLFSLPEFIDSTKFSLQMNNLKGEKDDYVVLPDKAIFPAFTTPNDEKQKLLKKEMQFVTSIQQNHFDFLINASGGKWLNPVTVKSDAKDKKSKSSNSRDFITHEMLKKGGFNNVGDAVLSSGKFRLMQNFLVSGGPNGFVPSASDEPTVIIDGVQAPVNGGDNMQSSPVLNYLKTLNTDEIEYVKLLSGAEAGIYGVRAGHGVIEIHTSTKLSNFSSATGLKTLYPKGFHVPRPFPVPNYNDDDIRSSAAPDLRTTLYWNGNVVTDDNGKVALSFFTADAATTYTVIVTGITITGEHIFATTVINRK